MELYQAPMEGITGHIYRNTIEKIFPGADKYFAPFITPCEKVIISPRDKKRLMPENNNGLKLVPQILTNSPEGFVEVANFLRENYGYEEVNLNLGCPSGTVVNKNRGAGALRDTGMLDTFLQTIFDKCKCRISIKTRIGYYSTDEVWELMEVYEKYPYSELIIHPRVRQDFYKDIHPEIYFLIEEKYGQSTSPALDMPYGKFVYNGNIFSGADLISISKCFTNTKAVMIGRGMVANPGIFREIKEGKAASAKELQDFLRNILWEYAGVLEGDIQVLHKMKEIWFYMGRYLVETRKGDERILKSIRKSRSISEYEIYAREFLENLTDGLGNGVLR